MTDIEMREIDKEYRCSFVYCKSFESKRFDRFVSKVEDLVLQNYIKIVFEDFLDLPIQDGNNEFEIRNFSDFIVAFFQYMYSEEETPEAELFYSLLFHRYSFNSTEVYFSQELFDELLGNPYRDSANSLANFIKEETREVCKEFIQKRTFEEEGIDVDNYFLILPDCFDDYVYIFDNVINYVKIDIENFASSQIENKLLETISDDAIKDLKKEVEILETKVEKLKQEILLKEDKIKSLRKKIEDNEKNEKTENLIEQNISLQRKIEKADRRYNDLLEKYNRLKEQNTQAHNEEVIEEQQEVDLNKRYCFVAYGDITFLNDILSVFPNSFFLTKNSDINNISADLVICLTEHIDHSTYYDVKKRCSNRNIPFIHCKHSNVELIKNSIAEYYQNQIC